MKVEIYKANQDIKTAIGVRLKQEDASLQDLLDAWQPLCDDTEIIKKYAPAGHAVCKGCQINCCLAVDVTPDLISCQKMARDLGLDIASFIREYFEPEPLAKGLLKLKSNPCIFLKDYVCSIYASRSLLCRFYLCSEMTGDTQNLIYHLSLMGAAATYRFARLNNLVPAPGNEGQGSYDAMYLKLIEDALHLPELDFFMKAEEYSQIPLLPFMNAIHVNY